MSIAKQRLKETVLEEEATYKKEQELAYLKLFLEVMLLQAELNFKLAELQKAESVMFKVQRMIQAHFSLDSNL